MRQKKIPMRRCVVTNQRFEKKELMRVVKTPEGNIIFDRTGKANGRGAYLSMSKEVIEKAMKTKILNKHLEADIPEEIFNELLFEVNHE